MNPCSLRFAEVRRVDVGCGARKREGHFGIDMAESPGVDLVHDLATTEWPFHDDQLERVYSNHCFEHLACPLIFLRELLRTCKDGASVEIWTPYGHSNEAFGYGHHVFLNELHWRHICWEHDRHYLGDAKGYFEWVGTNYAVFPQVVAMLRKLRIPLAFALQHMHNIAPEWGVELVVRKHRARAPGPQWPAARCTVHGQRDQKIPGSDATWGGEPTLFESVRSWVRRLRSG